MNLRNRVDPKRCLTVLLLIVAVYFAFFWRLDGALLWRDEATTACWGRALSESDSLLPTVWDGEQLIVQGSKGHDFNRDLRPAMQSWLQFYVSAFAFRLLGVSTFSARFPFALIGILGIPLFYLIFKRLTESKNTALIAASVTVLSMPYLHYARQSRYYVLVLVIALAVIHEVVRGIQSPERRRSAATFARLGVYGVLLFLSNYFTFGILWIGVLLSALVVRERHYAYRLLLTTLAVSTVITPMLIGIHGSFIERAEITKFTYLVDYGTWFMQALGRVNHLMPIPVLLILGGFLLWRHAEETATERGVALWLWLIILSTVLVSVVLNKSSAFLRYYLHIIPIAILVVGIYAIWISRIWGRVPAVLFVGLLLIYHNDSPILEHSQSILTRQFAGNDTFNGPMVEFLQENVKPGERVAFTQNDIGMVAYFYLPRIKWSAILEATNPYNLPYRKRLSAEMFDDYTDVEWVVVWAKRGLPQRVETDYEMVWNYRFGPNISRKAIEQKIYTPQQVTITQAEEGMPMDLRYFDFYRKQQLADQSGTL